MKKILLILFCVYGLCYSYAKPDLDDIVDKTLPSCNEVLQNPVSLYNFRMMGDALLNFSYLYSLQEAIERGYKTTLTLKNNSTNCEYKSKTVEITRTYNTYNDSMYVVHNTIYNLKAPGSSSWEATLKIVSTCVYDPYISEYVNFTWTKTYKTENPISDFNMGYSKATCPNAQSIVVKSKLLNQMIKSNMLQY